MEQAPSQTDRLLPPLGRRLLVASHNPGKLSEIAALLQPLGFATESAAALGLPEPEETGASYEENARLKALAGAAASGLPALADDSGLSVAALGGAPGIHSARWAEGPGGRDFGRAMKTVEDKLEGSDDRRAEFVCVLCLAWPDGPDRCFEGRVGGALTWPPRGTGGFGYDPIFVPEGYEITFGEMEPEKKHAISHRARAFERFRAFLARLQAEQAQ
ncbi:MAG: RdgB/HAM1 family non-canonical purine NTP pyrophosphatase [Kiloniellales bacterium]